MALHWLESHPKAGSDVPTRFRRIGGFRKMCVHLTQAGALEICPLARCVGHPWDNRTSRWLNRYDLTVHNGYVLIGQDAMAVYRRNWRVQNDGLGIRATTSN